MAIPSGSPAGRLPGAENKARDRYLCDFFFLKKKATNKVNLDYTCKYYELIGATTRRKSLKQRDVLFPNRKKKRNLRLMGPL